MSVYYNEHDPYAAEWLRNLIRDGHIAHGVVDERSIEDVRPDELGRFVQCHFFAGIGVWSAALRGAGWRDDRRVWTASCPCQPFSTAGKGDGFADERHLWPALFHLIEQCRPPVVIGEQVASGDAAPWIDLVQTDMEDVGYTFGAVPFPATSVGAPHIRDRLYWVGHTTCNGPKVWGDLHTELRGQRSAKRRGISVLAHHHHSGLEGWQSVQQRGCERAVGSSGVVRELADAGGERSHRQHARLRTEDDGRHGAGSVPQVAGDGEVGNMANTVVQRSSSDIWSEQRFCEESDESVRCGMSSSIEWSGPVNGFWRDADWIFCTDNKWRPIEPGSEPLAHGFARSMGSLSPWQQQLARVAGLDAASLADAKRYRTGSLRGYGNAIVKPQAEIFIRAFMESL